MANYFTDTDSADDKIIGHIYSGIQDKDLRTRVATDSLRSAGFIKSEISLLSQLFSYRIMGKRMLDLTFVILAMPFAIIILIVIAIMVARHGGTPFYRHWRVGKNGKAFGCLKVRTMTPDASERLKALLESDPEAALEWKETQKLRNDPRITRIGKILRKTSLDELPQLWNVLVGDMSLVGPRPVTLEELDRFGTKSDAYTSVHPGITGPWQINPVRNIMTYDERVAIEASYANQVSFIGDIKVLFGTLKWAMAPNGR